MEVEEEEVVCRYFNSFRNVLLKEFSNFEKRDQVSILRIGIPIHNNL